MKSTQNKNNIFSNIDIVAFLSNVTNFKYSIVLSTILITVFAGYYALKLEPTFDVKDFFDPNSEFVIGLDNLPANLKPTKTAIKIKHNENKIKMIEKETCLQALFSS